MQIRTPAVSGTFYSDQKNQLNQEIKNCFSNEFGPKDRLPVTDSKKVYGILSPHAGYAYSGPVAAQSYHAISKKKYDLAIIIGPNHWGIGVDIATLKDCIWQTPLGDIEVDSKAVKDIVMYDEIIEVDFDSHTKDHSLEVQIPMLQSIYQDIKILPILLKDQDKDTAEKIGNAVAKVASKKKAIIVGSSDLTHYEPNQYAHGQDLALLETVKELDVEEFYSVLHKKGVSACGYGAIAATMTACKKLGATKGQILQYATSGDITGDKSSVVGYGSVVFT